MIEFIINIEIINDYSYQWYHASQSSHPTIGDPSSWLPQAGQIHTCCPPWSYKIISVDIEEIFHLIETILSSQICIEHT